MATTQGNSRCGRRLRRPRQRHVASIKFPGLVTLDTYGGHFALIYDSLPRDTTEGVVFKRRCGLYAKQTRASVETRDWLKRRFAWD
jgi:hypothetical protein